MYKTQVLEISNAYDLNIKELQHKIFKSELKYEESYKLLNEQMQENQNLATNYA